MSLKWGIDLVIDDEYKNYLNRCYSNLSIENLIKLNQELRIAFLSYSLEIENLIKNCFLNSFIFEDNQEFFVKNFDNYKKALNIFKNAKRKHKLLIKNKKVKSVFKVLSYEWTIKILLLLKPEKLKIITSFFEEDLSSKIIINWFIIVKDVRNYCSHNYKFIGSKKFFEKLIILNETKLLFSESTTNNYEIIIKIIDKLSSKNLLLHQFKEKIIKIYSKYKINDLNNLM